MKRFFFCILFLTIIYSSYGQKKIEKIPDLLPVRESYLFSGKLDSVQYNYFLNGILQEQFDARRERLKRVSVSRETLLDHQYRIKQEYIRLLGPMPSKTPLNPVITGKFDKGQYTIEKVAFESRPDHHVTALLYIPDGEGPFPGILHMPGHSYTSKGRDYYQRIGRYFALNGFVVLQTDPVGQGERCQICQDTATRYFDNRGIPLEQNATGQHELYNEGLILLGSGVVAWEAWDNIRSIDYLCSRNEVDTTRIGVTGLSGGGTQTTYLVPLDARIKVAVPSSYIATTEEKFKTIGSQDGCQQLFSEGMLGIEEQDFLFMAAPVPILVLSTFDDFFSYKGSVVAVNELKNMYRILGYEERVKQFSAPGGHGMPYLSLATDVRWMSWWLKGDSTHIVNDTTSSDFLELKDTYVTKTGQVISYFRYEKSILDYSIDLLEQTRKNRFDFLSSCSYDDLAKKVIELTGYENSDNIRGGFFKGTFEWEGLKIEKHLINRDGLQLPALIIKPEKRVRRGSPAIILAGCFGKMNELVKNKQLVLQKLKEGFTVMIVDVSNTGELRTPEEGRDMSYEFSIAKMPVYAGRTLLGYRTQDLIIAKNYLKSVLKNNSSKIELLTSEQIGPCAVHAAFLDGSFSKLYLKDSPESWEKLVTTHFKPDNIGIIVPNVLKFYDLPDLIRFMSGTEIEID